MKSNSERTANGAVRSSFRLAGETLAKISILLIVVSPLVTYALPENALIRWPFAAHFADFVARLVPAIDKLTVLSQFPQVTRLFLALLWGIVFPVLLALAFVTRPQENHLRRMKAPAWIVWMAPMIGITMCWAIVDLPFVYEVRLPEFQCDRTPFDECICLASTSRLWLGLFCTVQVFAMAIFAAAIYRWPGIIRQYYANK